MKSNKIKIGSNRSFGIVFFIVFLIVALYPLLNDIPLRLWSLIIALIFLVLGLIKSNILNPINILWMKFGMFLGVFISTIIMGIIIFFVVTQIGLIMRLFGKDLLNLKKNKTQSYWLAREKIKSSMKNQF